MRRNLLTILIVLLACSAVSAQRARARRIRARPPITNQTFFTGTTRAASTCAVTDVQAKVNQSADLDIVTVPTGTCTWNTPLLINNLSIKLVGNSENSADAITCGTTGQCIDVAGISAAKFVRITNFRFVKGTANSDGAIQVSGTIGSQAFRFDHITMTDAGVGSRGIQVTGPYGLMDHLTFTVNGGGSIQSVSVYGSSQSSDLGHTPWHSALSLGTINAVIIEDSTLTYTSNQNDTAIDCYAGGRLVVRNTTITGTSLGCHGLDSGSIRSPVSIEIYNNTLTNNSGTNYQNFSHRGGVLMAWNNTFSGPNGWNGFAEQMYRMDPADASNTSTWQRCDGTNWELGSTTFSDIEGSTASSPGTPQRVLFRALSREIECLFGAGSDGNGACNTYLDGSGTSGYPCRDQISVGPGQTVFGDYQWNNGSSYAFYADSPGKHGAPPSTTDLTIWAQANRNYFDGKATAQTSQTSPFDGTTGVGWGITGRKPATCTAGVLYYDTDAGVGYKCTATDTWTSYYSAFTYPHPYQASRS